GAEGPEAVRFRIGHDTASQATQMTPRKWLGMGRTGVGTRATGGGPGRRPVAPPDVAACIGRTARAIADTVDPTSARGSAASGLTPPGQTTRSGWRVASPPGGCASRGLHILRRGP